MTSTETHSNSEPAATRTRNAAQCAIALRELGQATVAELSARTGLSRPTVEVGLDAMTGRGVVSILGDLTAGGRGAGRPARIYAFRARAGYLAAVDVGPHRVRVALADLSGGIAGWLDRQTDADAVGPNRMTGVRRAIDECLREAGVAASELVGMGVAVTGMVGLDGRLIVSRNLPDWEGVDVAAHLGRVYDCPVTIENDIRMAALAEHRLGAARLADDVLYLFAGHRVSMALIIDGKLRHGRHSAAGEMGGIAFSMPVDDQHDQLRWRTAASGEGVFRLAADGDEESLEEVRQFTAGLATGVAVAAMTVDPDLIVVGGGLSSAGGVLLDPLREAVCAAIPVPVSPTIIASELGSEAVALGTLVHAFGSVSTSLYGAEGLPEPTIDVDDARSRAREAAA
ncbi:ROK family protein [Microbacterium sp. ARD32]|uniref:ROK family transcriptional regulator n=1 Tax=Microbacterium sp. ARD32 TaxID=2962577 RepID=UPI002881F997|nr:ROK family protein [Microbacterium sp. ARD32]MDT0157123.1 ROK family protein [Microbacterium sp. ARD32]